MSKRFLIFIIIGFFLIPLSDSYGMNSTNSDVESQPLLTQHNSSESMQTKLKKCCHELSVCACMSIALSCVVGIPAAVGIILQHFES